MIAPLPPRAAAIEVVVLPPRVTPVPRVTRELDDGAIAPRRDTASFSAEALARLAAEAAECAP